MAHAVARVLVSGIALYQAVVSPLLPPSCRFVPSCSRYAREAINRYGPARGLWLAVKRIGRCHPFGGHGHDPVPDIEHLAGERHPHR